MNMHSQITQMNDQLRASLTPKMGSGIVLNGALGESSAVIINLKTPDRANKIHITDGAIASASLSEIFESVRSFNSFTEDNDPHAEHDFGSFKLKAKKFFWKIDYFDSNFEFFQENGNRVLTIMLAEEY